MPFALIARLSPLSAVARSLRTRALLGSAAILGALVLGAAAAPAAAAYANPFIGELLSVGRTDMGVDVCLSPGQPIRAIGTGVVTGIMRDWSEGQPYIWYELTAGPQAGRYVYVAEQIKGLARVGQTLRAGDVVARYASKGTCIETGWSTASGATVAQSTTGYSEGDVTPAGVSFARFLISLGVPGDFNLVPAKATRVTPGHHKRKHHR